MLADDEYTIDLFGGTNLHGIHTKRVTIMLRIARESIYAKEFTPMEITN